MATGGARASSVTLLIGVLPLKAMEVSAVTYPRALSLGPLSLDHCQQVVPWRNHAREVLRTPFFTGPEMQAEFYRSVVCDRRGPHRYFAIDELSGDGGFGWSERTFVGMGSLTSIAWEAGTAEIGIILDPAKRGQGIGREAVWLLLREAFHVMRLTHVYGEVYGCNTRGFAFWQRLAHDWMGTTAMLPARTFWNGQHWDSLYFDFDSVPDHHRADLTALPQGARR